MIKGVLIIRKVTATINLQDPSFKVIIYLIIKSSFLLYFLFHRILFFALYNIIFAFIYFIQGNRLIKRIFTSNNMLF